MLAVWIQPRPRAELLRRLIVVASLAVYLATAIGFPAPASAWKDHSQPFPCQDCACSCRSAKDCWTRCQCHTLEQRIAWAQARGIEPPRDVVRRYPKGWDHRDRSRYATRPTNHGCALCPDEDSVRVSVHSGCCSVNSESQTSSTSWCAGWAEQTCQGWSLWWVISGSSLPPVPACWRPATDGWQHVAKVRELHPQHCCCPPSPPPRGSAFPAR
jgi:hypothetical protein